MPEVNAQFPLPLPDDPKKWDGWSKYKSPNFYERLCLDPSQHPSNEAIEEHCRELLRWWQKKLPLKNQPSNPISQLLRPGLDESSRYLTEARVELLDPHRRQILDNELAAQAQQRAVAEFHKFLNFATANGTLNAEAEKNLLTFGRSHNLTDEQMRGYIEANLAASGAKRVETPPPRPPPAPPEEPRARRKSLSPKDEFMRVLRLSKTEDGGMSDDARDAFIDIAENLGIDPGEAEDMVDVYLEEEEQMSAPPPKVAPAPRIQVAAAAPKPTKAENAEPEPTIVIDPVGERKCFSAFVSAQGIPLLFVPSGEFVMGSEDEEAAPNERPTTKIGVSRFCMSKYPITNAAYEQFDPSHQRKRAGGAGDRHPVVYVSSLDAMKFCQWLSTRERKRYRLPTEAEWEYAARGTDGRKYPWGNHQRRGDLANFADKNTVFAWSDHEIDDGFAESSPIASFPRGASPFGLEDMAGNVWEWCLDYFEPYRGTPKINPRGPNVGVKRVYRGGSWKSRFNSLRATTRGSNAPNYSCNDLGFRIVCECE